MNAQRSWGDMITIEVVKGGFILSYPTEGTADVMTSTGMLMNREVFNSIRKLNQKLKDVIEKLSYVTPDMDAQ